VEPPVLTTIAADSGLALTLVPQRHEPLIVRRLATAAPAAPGRRPHWLVMVHALGENRTGNNYWQAQAATALAGAGLVVACFDLSGYGESLQEKDLTRWQEQLRDAVRTGQASGAATVHVTARGLHAALLADIDPPGQRIALYPPEPENLGWWSLNAARWETAGHIEASRRPDPGERAFWQACGAEAGIAGGLRIPAPLLTSFVTRFRDGSAQAGWDLAVVAAKGRRPVPARLVCGHDPLTRLESDRRGLEWLLTRHLLRATPAWKGDRR
jgi:hypothetical protein